MKDKTNDAFVAGDINMSTSLLIDFLKKGFPEQVGILTQLGKNKDRSYLPDLFTLFEKLTGDKTLDTMIEHTLRDILAKHEAETVRRLTSGTSKEKKICLQIITKEKFPSAVELLLKMVTTEKDIDILTGAFLAMAEIRAPDFLSTFRSHLTHSNDIIAGVCIEMMGVYQDTDSIIDLERIILDAESEEKYDVCRVETAEAIETLSKMIKLGNDKSLKFLISKIHHKNPTARRIIQEELIRYNKRTLNFMQDIFYNEDHNIKVMAAYLIGQIGEKKGVDLLISALDRKQAANPNVRASIYEAFGHLKSMKSLVCLVDALEETDYQVLITALTALDSQVNPGMMGKIKEAISAATPQSNLVIKAIVGARAVTIFKHFYTADDEELNQKLMFAILESNDPETLGAFAHILEAIPGKDADRKKIETRETKKKPVHVLAVDDSRSMLLFYRQIISSMDVGVRTVINARDALDLINDGDKFQLVITDLNMPIMDGIEFTRRLREHDYFKNVPILMCTTEHEASQVALAKKSGVSDFITKPIQPEQFKEQLRGYMGI